MSARRGAALLVGAVLVAAALGAAPVTLARFTASISRGASFGTATLAPPTSLAGSGGTTASLTWTASTSAGASGYRVLRSATSGSGYGQVSSVTPVSATGTSDNPAAGTWYYVLRTYFASWTSANSNEASVVVATGPTSTGPTQCTGASNAPETVNAGDNNGYESAGRERVRRRRVRRDRREHRHGRHHQLHGQHHGQAPLVGLQLRAAGDGRVDQRDHGHALGRHEQQRRHDLAVRPALVGRRGDVDRAEDRRPFESPGSPPTRSAAPPTPGAAPGRWATSAPRFRVRVIDSSTQPNKDLRLDGLAVSVTYTP